jgi:CubicO group peptidase (beta-lactamase class C family)
MEPGKEARYSSGGYTVLQQLMVDATGAEFPELMTRLVLRPVGMTNSTYEQPLGEGWRSSAASAHLWHGNPVDGSWHTFPEMAAAGLWSTPTDLARFAIELWRSYHGRSETFLPQEMTRRMLTRESGEFGLGLWLPREGVARFQHGGAN